MATKAWKLANVNKLREYRRRHYANNKEVYKERAVRRRREAKKWIRELKQSLKCSRCPEKFWACLEFHHVDPSTKEVGLAEMYQRGWSKKRMQQEVDKCEVLCANCHRKEHFRGEALLGMQRSPKPPSSDTEGSSPSAPAKDLRM